MKIERFQDHLDRFGADFDAWPAVEARRAKSLLAVSEEARARHRVLEDLARHIATTRPQIEADRAQAVLRRTLTEIACYEARPRLMDQLRFILTAPLPRAAFAFSLTAIGFAIGIAVGNPEIDRTADVPAGPLTIASADDVLY